MGHTPETRRRAYLKMVNLRREWFSKNGPCKACGSWDDLELDHVDPNSKIEHKVWSWSEARRHAELAKCQALCYSCHKKKSAMECATAQHGSISKYNGGCRCNSCRQAITAWKRTWRERTGRH